MSQGKSGWSRKFDEPIALADGRKLVTLRDAANYITGLPKKESALPEWQAAIEALMLVVEQRGPTMFARIGVMQALNRGQGSGVHRVREEALLATGSIRQSGLSAARVILVGYSGILFVPFKTDMFPYCGPFPVRDSSPGASHWANR